MPEGMYTGDFGCKETTSGPISTLFPSSVLLPSVSQLEDIIRVLHNMQYTLGVIYGNLTTVRPA